MTIQQTELYFQNQNHLKYCQIQNKERGSERRNIITKREWRING